MFEICPVSTTLIELLSNYLARRDLPGTFCILKSAINDLVRQQGFKFLQFFRKRVPGHK